MGHTQALPLQVRPPVQAVPQAPQFCRSVCVLTQLCPHFIRPVAQLVVHALSEHTAPFMQTVPHEPQLAASALRFTQPLAHGESPVEQAHMPLVQACELAHAFPHEPQFAKSVAVLTHLPLQLVVP